MKSFALVPNVQRVQRDIEIMASFTDQSKSGWTRRSFTSWHQQGREWLRSEMIKYGMEVETDAASNLIGRINGSDLSLPPIMIGSHTDTVDSGGRFDGIIGVLAGLEIARRIKETGTILRHSLEIVDFTAEEPSEFGVSTVGSRGMVNNLSEEMLNRKDPSNRILKDVINEAEGNYEKIEEWARKKGDISLYLELHIEQGPVLEQTGNRLGVVTGIVGIQRYRVIVSGKQNHAGTTPMKMRNDALTGAAKMTILLEKICNGNFDESVVGTIGKFKVEPNASNVIPGRVEFELEVRSLDEELLNQIISEFKKESLEIAKTRGLTVEFDHISKSEAIRIDHHIKEIIKKACELTNKPYAFLSSGAGHDANQIARIAPIGMVFVPSKEGRSHCPEEWTSYEDVALGVEALGRALLLFDQK